jgi:hypothetical protein
MRGVCVAAACVFLVACGGTIARPGGGSSGGSSSASSSGSSSGGPSPDAFVQAIVGAKPQIPTAGCSLNLSQELLLLGTPSGGKPTTVQDGESVGGQSVQVTCRVTSVGSGFDISLDATFAGPYGGSLSILSGGGLGEVTPSGGLTIAGTFQNGSVGRFGDSDCTITFTYDGAPVPDSPPIAPGRIWGHISCPNASDETHGGRCDVEVDFLFENCDQ